MDVVFMRRIAGPVAAGSIHLHYNEALAGESRGDDVIDLPRRVVASAYLDFDIARRNEARLVILVGGSQRDGEFAIALRSGSERGPARQVECMRQSAENALSLPNTRPPPPVRLNA